MTKQPDKSTTDEDREERFDEICADFLDAVDGGQPFDKEGALSANPDLAESLQNFFRDHARMAGVLDVENNGPPSAAGSPGSSSRNSVDRTLLLDGSRGNDDRSGFLLGQPLTDEPGRRIADYELIEKIAQGGMGVVYKARQLTLNRVVALKMIRSGELADDEEVQRFRAEAEAAAQLHHPGIVPIYQIGVEGGQNFFSMAYIEGDSLADRVREKPLAPKVAANYVLKVARAVHFAHEQGIIHRDIKPANVLLDSDDNPMVTDFGLAKQIQSDHKLTMSGQVLGTASYMSPEQARGDQSQVGPRSDVYSLGALLYTLLTQRPPFTGDNPIEILLEVLSKDPVAPLVDRSKSFSVPFLKNLSGISKAWVAKEESSTTSSSSTMRFSRDIETICMKCLEKKPANRYASAEELAGDLERFLNGVPIKARPVNVVERTVRWCQRKPAISTAIVLAIALVVGLPLASSFAKVIKSAVYGSQFGTIASDAAKHYWGNNLNDELLDPAGHTGKDKLYILASRAMLRHLSVELEQPGTESHNALLKNARRDYEDLSTELTAMLQEAPSDSLRFASADCLAQLARYAKDNAVAMQRHCDDAESQLLKISQPSSLSLRLLAHVRELKNQAYYAGLSHQNLEQDARVKKAGDRLRGTLAGTTNSGDRSIEAARGLVRFEFSDDDIAVPLTNERVIAAHSKLTQMGRAEGAKAYIKFGFDLDGTDIQLTSRDRQQLFTDLTLLSERILGNRGNADTTSLPIDSWPGIWAQDPRGIYDTALGIALANTDAADRGFQVE